MEKLHPAVTVTNIRNFIPITLEMENAQYTSWVELFKIHCRAFQVIDHICPPAAAPTSSSKADDTSKDSTAISTELWDRLDAIVLQWIYGTISNDLLHTILKPNSTAAQAWQALANIFQDNCNTRALYLENKFSNTRLSDFPNVTAYCQALKVIADQLTNVDAPVSNQRLVLQLIAGLNEQFDGVAMLLQQTSPLPEFTVARSKLILEETRKANQTPSHLAPLHTTTVPSTTHTASNQQPLTHPTFDQPNRGYSDPSYRPNTRFTDTNSRGRGRNSRGRGRGRSRVEPTKIMVIFTLRTPGTPHAPPHMAHLLLGMHHPARTPPHP